MMLLGFIWAAFAPLSLVLLVALLNRLLRPVAARSALPLASLIVVLPVAVVWYLDRADFRSVCTGEGKPVIYRKAQAEGIYLNSGTSNSFGMRYLQDEGFAWVEAPSIYKRGEFVRYERDSASRTPGAIRTVEISGLTAQYEVREDFSQPFGHTGLSQTRIIDRTTGDTLAKAGSATFSGGRMKWVLGAYGASHCPSAMSSPDDFTNYYHLAKRTLR